MAILDIKVPDIGDFAEVTVIELMVKPGDTVKPDQSLITVESDKASMEIPCSHGGVVKELKVKLGDKVKEGSVVLVLEGEGAEASPSPSSGPAKALPVIASPSTGSGQAEARQSTPLHAIDQPIIRIDPRYFRPTEVETLLGDPSKANQKLGWVPEITAQEMCAEMVAHDLAQARQHALLKQHGFDVNVSVE